MQIHTLLRLDVVLANSCLAGLGTAKEERNARIPNPRPLPRRTGWNGKGAGLFLEPLFHGFMSLDA